MLYRHEQNKKEKESTRENKPKKEKVDVWVLKTDAAPASSLDHEWPEFNNDRERIKKTTDKYKDLSIVDAFKATGAKITKKVSKQADITPTELRVGQVIPAHMLSVTKDGVLFDTFNSTSSKQNILCHTNLYKYELFRKFIPKEDVLVKVLSVKKDRVVVDPLIPIFDNWISDVTKNAEAQRNIKQPQVVKVKNLHLVRGGFVGKAVVPAVSKFIGDEYTIDAFIPGSQIVLNIESDFSRWEGKTVETFVTNYMVKPGTTNEMSLICSAKEYLKFQGDKYLIELFKHYCEDDEEWKKVTSTRLNGVVTGIINSSKKCGVFVEIPTLHITGMIGMNPEDIVGYKPQQGIDVCISSFEESTYYDAATKQVCHNEPYKIEEDILKSCSLKPVLTLA